MTQQTQKTIRFWYGIFLSVFTLVVGILFLASVSDIYFSAKAGEQIFTREILNERLLPAIILFCIWIAAVIAGFVLSVVFPFNEKQKRKQSPEKTFARLKKRLPQGEGEDFQRNLAHVAKAEKIRIVAWCVCGFLCVAAGVVTLVYVFDPAHFATTQFNADMLNMAKWVLPCVAVSFVACIVAAVAERMSAARALPYLKSAIAAGGKPQTKAQETRALAVQKQEEHILLGVRIAVAVLGVAMLIWGICNGGANDVLTKAINICTECIGLG